MNEYELHTQGAPIPDSWDQYHDAMSEEQRMAPDPEALRAARRTFPYLDPDSSKIMGRARIITEEYAPMRAENDRLRKAAVDAVPTSWLDPALTGQGSIDFRGREKEVESLLRRVKKRVEIAVAHDTQNEDAASEESDGRFGQPHYGHDSESDGT